MTDAARRALGAAISMSDQRAEGVLYPNPSAILPSEDGMAREVLNYLATGGWHLVHADDLPAGYMPGDAVVAASELWDHA